MASETETAWAAGLFEGVGKIRYVRDMLGLKFGVDDLDIVVRFRDIAGYGAIRQAREAPPFFEWSLGRQKECRELMIRFWPYLGLRSRRRWNRVLEKRELAFYPRVCPVCGDEYKPTRKAQVCCDKKCSSTHVKRQARKERNG